MNFRDEIANGYFEWMSDIVCGDRFPENVSYRKLLMYLHCTEFTFTIRKDINRAEDGVALRRRYTLAEYNEDLSLYLDGPCSVLEMMLALAIRCEESIMDDSNLGDRTGQWFWGMITNLGLGGMTDDRFDRLVTDRIISTFLKRKYEPDGKGGLFTIRHCKQDLRRVEIWYQLNWYLDSIIG